MSEEPSRDTQTGHWLEDLSTGERHLEGASTQGTGGSPDWIDLPELPASLGPYRLLEQVGRGGMGVVYRAFEPTLRREVALKLLGRRPTPRNVRRFRDEAQVTAQLQHPGIVPVYAIGLTPDEGLYYTMRLVRGATLERVVQDRDHVFDGEETVSDQEYSFFRVLQIFLTVCRTIAYAHARGVVHRDLKPSNVIVGPFGDVHVLDWGLAKLYSDLPAIRAETPATGTRSPELEQLELPIGLDGDAGDTRLGTIAGTPVYMAPEQAHGDPEALGPAVDVYALGGILYYVLTGRPPRRGTTDQVLKVLNAGTPPPPPRSVAPSIPSELAALCQSALASDPHRRLPSADALANAIQAYQEGRPLTASSPDTESGPIPLPSTSHYRRPGVSVHVVVATEGPQGPRVLLKWCEGGPFADCWSLFGANVKLEERLEEAAHRAIRGKLEGRVELEPLGVWDDLDRDPRSRVIGHGFLARIAAASAPVSQPNRAWFALEPGNPYLLVPLLPDVEMPRELAFDHGLILAAAARRLLR